MNRIYTQSEIAEKFGVTRVTVSRWVSSGKLTRTETENGQLVITNSDIKKFKRPLNGGYDNVATGKLIASIEKILILLKSKEWSDLEHEEITGLEQMLAEIKKK